MKSFIVILLIVIILIGGFFFIKSISGNAVAEEGENSNLETLTLKVNIPCPGHANLVMLGIKDLEGVKDVTFELPNKFIVKFNPEEVNKETILNAEIFKEFNSKEI